MQQFTKEHRSGFLQFPFVLWQATINDRNYRIGATCQLNEQDHVAPHKIEAILTLQRK